MIRYASGHYAVIYNRSDRRDPKLDRVVRSIHEILLRAEVSFGRLNRDVPEQELNLIEFSAGKVA